jgi:hypothetical protein
MFYTYFTEKSARISGTCSSGTKTEESVVFSILLFNSNSFLCTHVEKLLCKKHFTVSVICSSAYNPPTFHLSPDALQHVLCNIYHCCSDLCSEFIQCVHSLALHGVKPKSGHVNYTWSFTWPQRRKPKGEISGEWGGHATDPPFPIHQPGKFVFSNG